MKVQQMNMVNLIGKMTTNPTVYEIEGEGKIARFSFSTSEPYLDKNGKTCYTKDWHRVTAWGKWATILDRLCAKGQGLAIEGRLRSRFYSQNGQQKSITEIEVNDLVIL